MTLVNDDRSSTKVLFNGHRGNIVLTPIYINYRSFCTTSIQSYTKVATTNMDRREY